MISLQAIFDFLRNRQPETYAKVCARFLGPLIVLGLASPSLSGGLADVEIGQAISISTLRSELLSNGAILPRSGIALTIDPIQSHIRVPIFPKPTHIWTSLAVDTVDANRDRLLLDKTGVQVTAPFLGVTGPVTMILDGIPSASLDVPGGTEKLSNFVRQSGRSASMLSGVLLACFFAFGMSAAGGFPSNNSKKNGTC